MLKAAWLRHFPCCAYIDGPVVSGAFSTATESLVEWTENDGATITEFLENLQLQFADVFNFIGQIFGDIGTIISNWWNGNGQQIFQNICNMFTNIGTTLMNVYNQWIKPAWDFIVAIVKSAWENWLKPVFEGAINFFGKLQTVFQPCGITFCRRL